MSLNYSIIVLYNVHWRVKLEAYTFRSLLLSSDALDNVLLAVISVYIVTTTFYWLLCQYIYILTTTFYYMLCLYISLQQRSISCYVNIYIYILTTTFYYILCLYISLQQRSINCYVNIYCYNNVLPALMSVQHWSYELSFNQSYSLTTLFLHQT